MTAEALVRRLDLSPHPEGGFFRETYRSPARIEGLGRACSTAILYLLPRGAVSRFHRLKSDELWHFHLGSPLRVWELGESGPNATLLGPDVAAGELLQHCVPAGTWFGAEPTGDFSLVGCTVAPGFDFADFELASRPELERLYPSAATVIARLA